MFYAGVKQKKVTKLKNLIESTLFKLHDIHQGKGILRNPTNI